MNNTVEEGTPQDLTDYGFDWLEAVLLAAKTNGPLWRTTSNYRLEELQARYDYAVPARGLLFPDFPSDKKLQEIYEKAAGKNTDKLTAVFFSNPTHNKAQFSGNGIAELAQWLYDHYYKSGLKATLNPRLGHIRGLRAVYRNKIFGQYPEQGVYYLPL